MIRRSLGRGVVAGLAVLAVSFAACTGSGGGFPRGQFHGKVVGKTEPEIVAEQGQPVEVRRSDPERVVLVYKEKTFDPDNGNKVDPTTQVLLHKDEKGTMVAYDVLFTN